MGYSIYRGVLTGLNEAFIVDNETKEALVAADPKSAEILKPILRGSDIGRYRADWAGLWVIATFPVLNLDINDYPAIKKHLLSFGKGRLEQTGAKGSRKKTGHLWYETQDSMNYHEEFMRDKIVWTAVNSEYRLTVLPSDVYANNSLFMITGSNLAAICAYLNSNLCRKYLEWVLSDEDSYTYGSKQVFGTVPVPEALSLEEDWYIDKVGKIIAAKADGKDTSALERDIDQRLYDLCGLTNSEVEIVEERR